MRCYNSFQKTAKPKNEHFTQPLLGVSKQQGFIQVEKSKKPPTHRIEEVPMGLHSSAVSPLRLWSATSSYDRYQNDRPLFFWAPQKNAGVL